MKGSATIIGGISGRAIVCQPCQGTGTRQPPATYLSPGMANVLPVACGEAERTRKSGLLSWIRVLPEQPQELVWLTPQVGIDYDIRTSSGLDWRIL